jgi:tetratricopeptide (TPR) repeat protein
MQKPGCTDQRSELLLSFKLTIPRGGRDLPDVGPATIMRKNSKSRRKNIKEDIGKSKKNPIILSVIAIVVVVLLSLLLVKNHPKQENTENYATQKASSNEIVAPAKFVGGKVCAECHQEQYKLWQGSDHDLAMQVASEKSVLGDFNNVEFNYFGVTSKFFKRDGKFMVHTDGPDGKLRDYEIKYTFGHYPLQQYLIEFPGGRLQALGIAWDSRPENKGGQRWFHLYPDEEIKYDDILHWTGLNQNWNYMCAECHSTNLQKNYDVKSNAYNTTWSEINVSCEACHGPGSTHVKWAQNAKGKKKYNSDSDKGLVVNLAEHREVKWSIDQNTGNATRSGPEITNVEIEICARCHSRRGQIWGKYVYGKPLMDTHLPALLEENLYYPDGQIKGEDYEYGSFLQSKMYQKGVTCTDCHNPHTLKLRQSGNGVCAECHLSSRYDSPSHHFHKIGSSGASCIGCHMPETTYMVVDPRYDHSIRIPRPDLSIKLGSPNACNKCHSEQTPKWAAEQMDKWYGTEYRKRPSYGEGLLAGRNGTPEAEALLSQIADDTSNPDIARATALEELRNYISPDSILTIRKGLRDGDPIVRLGALDALENVQPHERAQLVVDLLNDPVRAVRIKAARMLAAAPRENLTSEQISALDKSLDEYIASQQTNADRPEANMNLGVLFAELGRFNDSDAKYRKALEIQPSFVQAYVNLADLYRLQGRDNQGEELLREALKIAPQDADVYHALGLLLVRQNRLAEALEALKQSAKLSPDNPHYSYVYAVALNSAGRETEAIEFLKETHYRHPNDHEILFALVTFNRDSGNLQAARDYAKELIELSPKNPSFRKLLEQLQIQDNR